MKKLYTLGLTILSLTLINVSCGKEEVIEAAPDNIIGSWRIYSVTDSNLQPIIWEELKSTLVELVPSYECFSFTCTASENAVTTIYTFINENSTGCLAPVTKTYSWSKDASGTYDFVLGTTVINYTITYSNDNNRMTWRDQLSGAISVWDRVQ